MPHIAIGFNYYSSSVEPPTLDSPYILLQNSPVTGSGGVYGSPYQGKFIDLIDNTFTSSVKFTGYHVSTIDKELKSGGTLWLVNPTNNTVTFRLSAIWPVNFWDAEYGITDYNGFDDPNLLFVKLYDEENAFLGDVPIYLQYLFGPSNPNWSRYIIGNSPSSSYDVEVVAESHKYITFGANFPVAPTTSVTSSLISYTYFQTEIL